MTEEKTLPNLLMVLKKYGSTRMYDTLKAETSIVQGLKKRFRVETNYNLDPSTADFIELRKIIGVYFDAIVTHVPHRDLTWADAEQNREERDFYNDFYNPGLSIIRKIKEKNPHLPIIAYTGAERIDGIKMVFLENGVSDMVYKSDSEEWQKDLTGIEEALDRAVRIPSRF